MTRAEAIAEIQRRGYPVPTTLQISIMLTFPSQFSALVKPPKLLTD